MAYTKTFVEVTHETMKCDDCKFQAGEQAGLDYPHPYLYCIKGHWEGGQQEEPDVDPWANCQDFQLWNGPQTLFTGDTSD